jgi:hypothetical protein
MTGMEWIYEDVGMEGVADDLLHLESLTVHVGNPLGNPEKRRRTASCYKRTCVFYPVIVW